MAIRGAALSAAAAPARRLRSTNVKRGDDGNKAQTCGRGGALIPCRRCRGVHDSPRQQHPKDSLPRQISPPGKPAPTGDIGPMCVRVGRVAHRRSVTSGATSGGEFPGLTCTDTQTHNVPDRIAGAFLENRMRKSSRVESGSAAVCGSETWRRDVAARRVGETCG